MHEPLSKSLARILDGSTPGITLNELLERTAGRGLYLVIILLVLPFIVPVSIPGFSTVLGLSVALLSSRLAFGQTQRLPGFLGRRKLSLAVQQKLLAGSVKYLRFIEGLVKPRQTPWISMRPARFFNALLMTFMALLLALPFPPLPPFTNSLPCYSIILLAVSMMEEDGVTIWIAYAVSLGTIVYLVIIAGVLQHAFAKVLHAMPH